MTELKPCPCGGKAKLFLKGERQTLYSVYCPECMLTTDEFKSEAEVVTQWNSHPMHQCAEKDAEIARLQTGFIRIIHEVKAGATDTEVFAICREMLGIEE